MSFDILNRWTRVIAYHSEKSTQREAILDAVKEKADLRGADLRGAVLSGAVLSRADLSGADLRGFKMKGPITQFDCAEWASGQFLAYVEEKGGLRIICGCRHFSYDEAVKHWADRSDRKMTRVALAMAKLWYDALQEVPDANS